MNNEEKILALLSTLQQYMNEMKQDISNLRQRLDIRDDFVQLEARLSEKIDDTLAGVYTVIGEHAVKLARAR